MKKVVTMGEIMLRLSTPGYQKIQQAQGPLMFIMEAEKRM